MSRRHFEDPGATRVPADQTSDPAVDVRIAVVNDAMQRTTCRRRQSACKMSRYRLSSGGQKFHVSDRILFRRTTCAWKRRASAFQGSSVSAREARFEAANEREL
jgi:hypothetical protein